MGIAASMRTASSKKTKGANTKRANAQNPKDRKIEKKIPGEAKTLRFRGFVRKFGGAPAAGHPNKKNTKNRKSKTT